MWICLGTQPAKIGRRDAICIELGQERKLVISSGRDYLAQDKTINETRSL